MTHFKFTDDVTKPRNKMTSLTGDVTKFYSGLLRSLARGQRGKTVSMKRAITLHLIRFKIWILVPEKRGIILNTIFISLYFFTYLFLEN